MWLFGDWKRLTALSGHLSSLEIDSEDCCALLFETERCPIVTVQLNYLDKVARREVIVNTDRHTFKIDFVNNTFEQDSVVEQFSVTHNETYEPQHQAMLSNDFSTLCTVFEGAQVLKLIDAAERAVETQQWVMA